jgi:hypothetical protein
VKPALSAFLDSSEDPQGFPSLALTQPIYEPERVRVIREMTRDLPIKILPGVMPILSPQFLMSDRDA